MLLVTICYLCLQNIYNFAAGIRHVKCVDLPNSGGIYIFPEEDFPPPKIRSG